jgi:hypothetical protein
MTKDEVLPAIRKRVQYVGGKPRYIDGKPVYDEPLKYELVGNVQPLNGRDLLLVPEGDRFKEQFWIFCVTPCVAVSKDLVFRSGSYYEVQGIELWGSFSKIRIMKVDVGPQASP